MSRANPFANFFGTGQGMTAHGDGESSSSSASTSARPSIATVGSGGGVDESGFISAYGQPRTNGPIAQGIDSAYDYDPQTGYDQELGQGKYRYELPSEVAYI